MSLSLPVKDQYTTCMESCLECLIDCKVCLTKMVGMKSMNDCPYCCIQCIEILQATIGLMAADSKFTKQQCALCAEVVTTVPSCAQSTRTTSTVSAAPRPAASVPRNARRLPPEASRLNSWIRWVP